MESIPRPISQKILWTLMLIQFTETLGYSIMIPVLPFLATDLGLDEFKIGLLSSIFSLCQLFSSPIIGKLSDRYGRKPLLIFSQLATLIGFILLGVSYQVWILVLARVVDGLLGSNMTVVNASLADITTSENRTKVYSISSGVFGAALILGPMLGGLLSTLSTLKYTLPMFLAAGICLISIILIFTVLPETYIHRPDKVTLKFNDIIPIREIVKFSKDKPIRRNLTLFFLYSFGFFMFIRTFLLIAMAEFNLTAELGGLYHTWIGIIRVLLQIFLVERLIRAFGEEKILFSGVVAMLLAMIGYGLSPVYWVAFIPLTFLAYGTGTARPVLTSRLTNCVGEKEYATILGINNSLTSLAQIFAPTLGGLILVYWKSIPLLIICGLMFTLMLVILILEKKEKRKS